MTDRQTNVFEFYLMGIYIAMSDLNGERLGGRVGVFFRVNLGGAQGGTNFFRGGTCPPVPPLAASLQICLLRTWFCNCVQYVVLVCGYLQL